MTSSLYRQYKLCDTCGTRCVILNGLRHKSEGKDEWRTVINNESNFCIGVYAPQNISVLEVHRMLDGKDFGKVW